MSPSLPNPPIIIIGMHRSGTSLVINLLMKLGLFAGVRRDRNSEATFFQSINDWLFYQAGCAWDNPEPIHNLLCDSEIRELVTEYIEYLLQSPKIVNYLGVSRYLRYGGVNRLETVWGWKDPRNTFTLPIWLDLFQNAKIIHVYRNGVDVAASLRARRQQQLLSSKVLYHNKFWSLIHWLRLKRGGFVDSIRAASLEGGFALWEAYLQEARSHIKNLEERAIEVKYEDLIAAPPEKLTDIAAFCGIEISNTNIAAACQVIDGDRRNSYEKDAELMSFARKMAPRLAANGY